ncbi:hypothetical protein LJC24_03150, partial [Desulfococcaceae bacterium OttesenSCG-928-F15]|nr:hypothetical protein [Desulfococcaceae bacterium OttesenSCG-928-F15]
RIRYPRSGCVPVSSLRKMCFLSVVLKPGDILLFLLYSGEIDRVLLCLGKAELMGGGLHVP